MIKNFTGQFTLIREDRDFFLTSRYVCLDVECETSAAMNLRMKLTLQKTDGKNLRIEFIAKQNNQSTLISTNFQ